MAKHIDVDELKDWVENVRCGNRMNKAAAGIIAIITAAAMLTGCNTMESVTYMYRYSLHFDAITHFIMICTDDLLAGFFDDKQDPVTYVRISSRPTSGWYEATLHGSELWLEPSDIQWDEADRGLTIINLPKQRAEWLRENFKFPCPAWVYKERQK